MLEITLMSEFVSIRLSNGKFNLSLKIATQIPLFADIISDQSVESHGEIPLDSMLVHEVSPTVNIMEYIESYLTNKIPITNLLRSDDIQSKSRLAVEVATVSNFLGLTCLSEECEAYIAENLALMPFDQIVSVFRLSSELINVEKIAESILTSGMCTNAAAFKEFIPNSYYYLICDYIAKKLLNATGIDRTNIYEILARLMPADDIQTRYYQ